MKKPYERLSGHGSSTEERGERSLESSRFWLAGSKAACFWIQKPEHTVFSPPYLSPSLSWNLWCFQNAIIAA